jgi:hypothetical protein
VENHESAKFKWLLYVNIIHEEGGGGGEGKEDKVEKNGNEHVEKKSRAGRRNKRKGKRKARRYRSMLWILYNVSVWCMASMTLKRFPCEKSDIHVC